MPVTETASVEVWTPDTEDKYLKAATINVFTKLM
jgi:hypothetical protein